jgi:tetratricopeptide (TPR) repeat protein
MKTVNQKAWHSNEKNSRAEILQLLKAGFETGSYRFARQTSLTWLGVFPGDLEVNLLLAKALYAENNFDQALPILEKITRMDPEFIEALELFSRVVKAGDPRRKKALEQTYILSGEVRGLAEIPPSVNSLRNAQDLIGKNHYEEAEQIILTVLGSEEDSILAAIQHLKITCALKNNTTIFNLANLYHSRWPDCLQFTLILAESQLESGDESKAVLLLHQCVANDAAGRVAGRFWGSDHPYLPLWPEKMEMKNDIAVPAEVARHLGWNMLASGPVKSIDEEIGGETEDLEMMDGFDEAEGEEALEDGDSSEAEDSAQQNTFRREPRPVRDKTPGADAIRAEFERIAAKINQPEVVKTDGRFPIYVIFSTREGLKKQYGSQTLKVVDNEMRRVADVIRKKNGWGSLVFYPDDPEGISQYGLSPIDPFDPWKLKLALVDLDKALGKKGQMIGALLIVGGPGVIPFHRLPNPTDDMDQEVDSDNPYSTLDSNYFVPEWPVGRLPGESGADAGMLIEQLRSVYEYHARPRRQNQWRFELPDFGFLERFQNLFGLLPIPLTIGANSNFGVTAEVWRRSSQAVFSNVSRSGTLVNSPPETTDTIEPEVFSAAPLGYYNLHGLPDTPEWYGQRDLSIPGKGPDYPVAITTKDLTKNSRVPGIVLSEACYGGYIREKREDESVALKFLSIGASCVVASTSTAYGSVGMPLIGADLLASFFWKHLKAGETAGEALLHAKLDLVTEMNKRQGFLDGEDQKTLISFILLGDPLVSTDQFTVKSKAGLRTKNIPRVKTVCDRQDNVHIPRRISSEIISQVKQVVEEYLPGLDTAEFHFSQPHATCDGTHHRCPTSELGHTHKHVEKNNRTGRVVVTISKSVKVAALTHNHYARVTLDGQGKMVKLAVSR